MDASPHEATTDDAEPPAPAVVVTSHETRPGKTVFTERNNTDGWIATDLTVPLAR